MKTAQVAFVIFSLLLCTRLTQSANVLAIFSYTFHTPYLVVIPYIKALIGKGHNVTLISSVGLLPDIQGVRHIRASNLDRVIDSIMNSEIDVKYLKNKWNGASFRANMYYNITHEILSDFKVQSLLKDKREHYDIVIMEPSFQDSFMGFAEYFDASLIGFSAIGCSWLVDYHAGNLAPSIYSPISTSGHSRGVSLADKWNNWIHIVEEWMMDRLVLMPQQLELYKQFFRFSAETFYKRRKNFSLMLVNQHFTLNRVRSNYPNVIEVAGMHMAEPIAPLEPELLEFLNGAEHGVIYFSMGVEIAPRFLPEGMEQKLLQTFSQLKQRVVWRHEMITMLKKSENVLLTSIASQRLLLEHPNMKLFITHGGLLSMIEAAYSGVPMLGIPMFFDQFDNVERMRQAGVALIMDVNELTVEQLTLNIKELLHNPSYTFKAKELSARFRDQPTSPLERAVWWTEYVLRHKGAPHMRMVEQELAFVPYYSLQFIMIIFGRIIITIYIFMTAVFMVISCLWKEYSRLFKPDKLHNALDTLSRERREEISI